MRIFSRGFTRMGADKTIKNQRLSAFIRGKNKFIIFLQLGITSGISRAERHFGLAAALDGRIVFTARNKNNYDIFSINQDGSDLRQLTENAGHKNHGAVVSPDNQFIAFVSDRSGDRRLWLMNMDGKVLRKLTDAAEDKEIGEDAPYFSSDGQWIYYVLYKLGKGSIRRVSINGGESSEVSRTDKNVFEPVPSPDGKLLAHAVHNDETDNPWQIGIQSLNDSDQAEKFFEFPAFRLRVRWLLDSKSVVFVDDKKGRYDLWQTDLMTGERKPLTDFRDERIYRFDISPDRRSFVLARGNYFYDAVLIEH